MLIIIGSSSGIEKDLNYIADSENGVDFIDTKVLFIATFYSPYNTTYIHEKLAHRPAIMLFDITNPDDYGVNLPAKYYTGIFPEARDLLDDMYEEKSKLKGRSKAKSKAGYKSKKIEEYTTLDDILDKLSRHDYDRSCLTENELKILDSQK
jgi:hypothetical protein